MTAPSRPLAGILWMMLSGLCFTGVNAIVKHVGQTVPPTQAVFLRYAFGLLFVLPMLPAVWRAGFAPRLVTRVAARGALHAFAVGLWFFSMARIPIGEVTAMGYLQPVWVTLGAAAFLGERLAARRLAAIFVAILGAVIVLRPGLRELQAGHFAMLVVAPSFGVSYLLAKSLTDATSPAVTLAWMALTVPLFLAPSAWMSWQPIAAVDLGWLLLTASIATVGHYLMLMAFRAAPITVTQPVTVLQLVWAVTIGAVLFAEPVDAYVVIGGGVILGSVIFIAWREARLRRARPVARVPEP
jgi:drug/metabolite transporter (DMT)-like permease